MANRGYEAFLGNKQKTEQAQVTKAPGQAQGQKKSKGGRPRTSNKVVASFKVDPEQLAIIREIAFREHREQADIIQSAFTWIIKRMEAKHYQDSGEHIKPGDEEQRQRWDNDFMDSVESIF